MSTTNKSPLRYPGGKTRACQALDLILQEHFDLHSIQTLATPFFGGGSFEFYLQNKYGWQIRANDKFTPLYHFWSCCKHQKAPLCQRLYSQVDQIEKSDFTDLRRDIMGEPDPLTQSVMYFIINRCSFSGATLSGGFSLEASKKRFTTSSVDRINKLDLDGFQISNLDFTDFLDTLETSEPSKTLLFLDPPYYLEKDSKLYGNNGDMHETFDHAKLHQCLSSKNNWFLTYNDCEYIRDLYQDFTIIDTSWSYGMNKSKASSEIVILGLY